MGDLSQLFLIFSAPAQELTLEVPCLASSPLGQGFSRMALVWFLPWLSLAHKKIHTPWAWATARDAGCSP